MQTILKTLVGSRAHGTELPDSDYDYRGVFLVPVEDILSPFRNVKSTSWIEGLTDDTAYELTHFCELCTHGNPSSLELLVAPVISETELGKRLRELLPAFLSKRCIDAFFGYGRNAEKKFREDKSPKKWKWAEAKTRILYQLIVLLRSGKLIIKFEGGTLAELGLIKRGMRTETEVMSRIFQLEEECMRLEKKTKLPDEPDIERIERFIFDAYLPQHAVQLRPPEGPGEMGRDAGGDISATASENGQPGESDGGNEIPEGGCRLRLGDSL